MCQLCNKCLLFHKFYLFCILGSSSVYGGAEAEAGRRSKTCPSGICCRWQHSCTTSHQGRYETDLINLKKCWFTEKLWLGKYIQISCKMDNQECTVCHEFLQIFIIFFFQSSDIMELFFLFHICSICNWNRKLVFNFL